MGYEEVQIQLVITCGEDCGNSSSFLRMEVSTGILGAEHRAEGHSLLPKEKIDQTDWKILFLHMRESLD